jgi:hypothetical protein
MMNNLLETIDLEVRIAAASSVRERLQVAAEQENAPHEVELSVIEALTDALITLRTEQIETNWLPRRAA